MSEASSAAVAFAANLPEYTQQRCEVETFIDNVRFALTTGDFAKQCDSAVWASLGDTLVQATVVQGTKLPRRRDQQIKVNCIERFYANGKMPIHPSRRERRVTEKKAILERSVARMVRHMLPPEYELPVGIDILWLGVDGMHPAVVTVMNAVLAALYLSAVPLEKGPAAFWKMGKKGPSWLLHPTYRDLGRDVETEVDLIGTREGLFDAILTGKEVPEQDLVTAWERGSTAVAAVIDLQEQLREAAAIPPRPEWQPPAYPELVTMVKLQYEDGIRERLQVADKNQRNRELANLLTTALHDHAQSAEDEQVISDQFELIINDTMRAALAAGKRPDGRQAHQLRPINATIDPWVTREGAALFCRGNTGCICTVTSSKDRKDRAHPSDSERYHNDTVLVHYNFWPFALGGVRGRHFPDSMEVENGDRIRRAIYHLLPDWKLLPPVLRLTVEVVAADGATTMAGVNAATLALAVTGYPLSRPVAGVTVGVLADGAAARFFYDTTFDENHALMAQVQVAGTKRGATLISITGRTVFGGKELNQLVDEIRKARQAVSKQMKTEVRLESRRRKNWLYSAIWQLRRFGRWLVKK